MLAAGFALSASAASVATAPAAPADESAAVWRTIASPADVPDLQPVWYVMPKNKYAKELVKIMHHLDGGDYPKAVKLINDMRDDTARQLAKNAKKGVDDHTPISINYPLWDIVLCMVRCKPVPEELLGDAAGELRYNPWAAYKKLVSLCDELKDDPAFDDYFGILDEFFAENKISFNLASIRSTAANLCVADVRQKHSIASYEELLTMMCGLDLDDDGVLALLQTKMAREEALFPDLKLRMTLLAEREAIAYELVCRDLTIRSAENYLGKYHSSRYAKHREDIVRRRDRLAYDQMPHTVEGCKGYLKNYPDSELREQVESDLQRYAYEGLADTRKACTDYLRDYPDSPYTAELKARIEQYDYADLFKSDKPDSYRKYLKDYPQTSHYVEIWDKIRETEASYYLRLDVPYEELALYLKSNEPIDPRLTNFFASLKNSGMSFLNKELKMRPKSVSINKKSYTQTNDAHYTFGTGTPSYSSDYDESNEAYYFLPIGVIYKFTMGEYINGDYMEMVSEVEYKIDQETGVLCIERAYADIDGESSMSVTYKPTFSNGKIVRSDLSDGSSILYDYNPDGRLRKIHNGQYKGGKFVEETVQEYDEYGNGVYYSNQDLSIQMEYNADHEEVAVVSKFKDGHVTKTKIRHEDYGLYGWQKKIEESDLGRNVYTRTFK